MAITLPSRKTLTLEAARVALAAAEAEALRNGWRVVIAVVDEGGHPVLLARLDGAQWSSISTAVEKARAAGMVNQDGEVVTAAGQGRRSGVAPVAA